MEVRLRSKLWNFIAGVCLLIAAAFPINAEDKNKLGIRFYGSFLYTEKVPNALFFFSDIEKNDSFELRKALRNHDIEILVLSSFGGSVWEGLNMAGIIHDKELTTYVPKLSVDGDGNCASACSFMFFGGKTRVSDGKVGVHQFYSGSASKSANIGESQEAAQFTVSEIIGFLNEFETPPFVFERMFQQSDMYYFDDKEMDKITRLANLLKEVDRSRIASFIDDFNVELALLGEELEEEENKTEAEPVKKVEPKVSPVPKKEPEPVKKVELKVSPAPKQELTTSETETYLCEGVKKMPNPFGGYLESDAYKEHVRNVQIELNRLNCNAGVADGIPGEKTRKAIETFYKTMGYIPEIQKYSPAWYSHNLLCQLRNSNKRCAFLDIMECETTAKEEIFHDHYKKYFFPKVRIFNYSKRKTGSKHKVEFCQSASDCETKTFVQGIKDDPNNQYYPKEAFFNSDGPFFDNKSTRNILTVYEDKSKTFPAIYREFRWSGVMVQDLYGHNWRRCRLK